MTHTPIKELIKNSQNQLDELRKRTIGMLLFGKYKYLILKNYNGLLIGIRITEFGAIQELHIDISNVIYSRIPIGYPSLQDLIDRPDRFIEWHETSFI